MEYKIASWNIRSMNNLKKQKEVLKMIREEGLSVCAAIEIHLKPDRITEISNRCFGGWDSVSNSVYSKNSCRIIVGWDPNMVKLMVLHMCRQSLFCLLEAVETKVKNFFTFALSLHFSKQ